MEDKVEDFLLSCSEIDFGTVNLSDGEQEFYSEWNNEIILLCNSLPESTQTDALFFFMKYSRISIGQELDFFKNYYVPSWSCIYWLTQYFPNSKVLSQEDIKNAITAHSMAMILHSLDDHINDREIPASHLTLLLRSQSWMIMNHAFNSLVDGIDGGEKIVQSYINDYYDSIWNSDEIESLDGYCDLFMKQMATWLIVPVLMAKKMTTGEEFTGAIQAIYGSFGVAWRLLDDIMDIEIDMKKKTHSAVYVCLPENIKKLWDKNDRTESSNQSFYPDIILDYILENNLIDRIQQRIRKELESAASISDNYNIKGLARELRCLLKPFKDLQDSL